MNTIIEQWLADIATLDVSNDIRGHLRGVANEVERTMSLSVLRVHIRRQQHSYPQQTLNTLEHLHALLDCDDFVHHTSIWNFYRRTLLSSSAAYPSLRWPQHAVGTSFRVKESTTNRWLWDKLQAFMTHEVSQVHRLALDEVLRTLAHFPHRSATIRPRVMHWQTELVDDSALYWASLLCLAELQSHSTHHADTVSQIRDGLHHEYSAIRRLSACYLITWRDRTHALAYERLCQELEDVADNRLTNIAAPVPWRALFIDLIEHDAHEQQHKLRELLAYHAAHDQLWTVNLCLSRLLQYYLQQGAMPPALMQFITQHFATLRLENEILETLPNDVGDSAQQLAAALASHPMTDHTTD